MNHHTFGNIVFNKIEIDPDYPESISCELTNVSCAVVTRYSTTRSSNHGSISEDVIAATGNSVQFRHEETWIDFTLYPAFDPNHPVRSVNGT